MAGREGRIHQLIRTLREYSSKFDSTEDKLLRRKFQTRIEHCADELMRLVEQ